ncbi:response regulator [Advenella kashmirensis]
MRVLLVEDDELIGNGIVAGLRTYGITVRHVCAAADAEIAQIDDTFHALILDLGLPDRDGLELLAIARALTRFCPY